MNRTQTFFTALTFLIILTACVLPGLSTQSAPLPTLTADEASINLMVAATVSAAVAQTEQSAPIPATAVVVVATAEASATSQPTATSIPTSTPTFAPEPTATPTPVATSQSQSALTKQENGSLLFSDSRAGYEIKLPAGWLVVRVNEKEYLDAFLLAEAANTNIQQALLGVQNENPNVLRLFAIDTQPAHIQNEFISDMRFVFEEGKSISLNSGADLQAIAEKIPGSVTAFRFEVTSVSVVVAASGMQFGVIEAKSAFDNTGGIEVPLYQKQVFFNTKSGLQSITLTTLADLKQTLPPAFDAMFEVVSLTAK